VESRQDDVFHDGGGGDTYNSKALDVKDIPFIVHDLMASRVNLALRRFVDWTGHSSFPMVIIVFIILFILFTMILALCINLNLWIYPECIHNGEHDPTTTTTTGEDHPNSFQNLSAIQQFHDAWILSWTTFSTAGYGLIAPSTSSPCLSLNVLCSMISFLGTVFSGFCAALIFSRIQSVQGEAPVKFSHYMKIKLERPHGVKPPNNGILGSTLDDKSMMEDDYIPVISFHMSNLFHTKVTGEIIAGKINVMANVDAYQVDEETRKRAGNKVFPNLLAPLRSKMSRRLTGEVTTSQTNYLMDRIKNLFCSPAMISREINGPQDVGNKFCAEESDPTTIFTKLAVSPDENPFFRVEWPVSHILDDNSPLLTRACKEALKHNTCPRDAQEKIRYIEDNIVFHEILVTFSGLANNSAESVFATNVYTFENLKFSPSNNLSFSESA